MWFGINPSSSHSSHSPRTFISTGPQLAQNQGLSIRRYFDSFIIPSRAAYNLWWLHGSTLIYSSIGCQGKMRPKVWLAIIQYIRRINDLGSCQPLDPDSEKAEVVLK